MIILLLSDALSLLAFNHIVRASHLVLNKYNGKHFSREKSVCLCMTEKWIKPSF